MCPGLTSGFFNLCSFTLPYTHTQTQASHHLAVTCFSAYHTDYLKDVFCSNQRHSMQFVQSYYSETRVPSFYFCEMFIEPINKQFRGSIQEQKFQPQILIVLRSHPTLWNRMHTHDGELKKMKGCECLILESRLSPFSDTALKDPNRFMPWGSRCQHFI